MKTVEKVTRDKFLAVQLKELDKECRETSRLISHLEIKDLSAEQIASILNKLAVSSVHLNAHTEGLQEIINEELERL